RPRPPPLPSCPCPRRRRPPRAPLSPYTTLFRSRLDRLPRPVHNGKHGQGRPHPERKPPPQSGGVGDRHRQRRGQTRTHAEHGDVDRRDRDRKSTRLNSRHVSISYAVFCSNKKINAASSH